MIAALMQRDKSILTEIRRSISYYAMIRDTIGALRGLLPQPLIFGDVAANRLDRSNRV